MTTLSLTEDDDWRALAAHLPKNYARLADEHKQLEVQYGKAKFTTADWLLRFILLHTGANLPLRQTVAMMAEGGGPSVSPMRLHMKMRRAAPYLQALVERMVGWTSETKPEQWAGYSMVLVDATVVCGPGAVGPDARIHTKVRAADATVLEAIVTDASGGETLKHFSFKEGELVVGDRLYANPGNVAHALEHGASVLVRHNRGSLPLTHKKRALDVLRRVRVMGDEEVLDLATSFTSGEDIIHGRFIATRLPLEKAEQARKRLLKKMGTKHTSTEALEAAGYMTLFTTVPRERMTAERCLQAYRLRWQIELQFKRWKSLCGFDRLPNYRDDTIVAWLYAKLLLGILLDRMGSIQDELSPPARLAPVEPIPRRPRRRRVTASDGSSTLETHQPSLPARPRRPAAALSA
jgi:hypothetical protein